jgi:hypothetical protein
MDDARLFLCARCQRQVRICSHCDRGNQYCGPDCARAARGESLRSAGARYQRRRRGRFCHAARQRRYRARCRAREAKVTHQGSIAPRRRASLAGKPFVRRDAPMTPAFESHSGYCHFCGRPVSDFVRLGWRRR